MQRGKWPRDWWHRTQRLHRNGAAPRAKNALTRYVSAYTDARPSLGESRLVLARLSANNNDYKHEIERLNNEYNKAFERLKSQQREIDRLKEENERFENNMKSVLEIEKKQAVEEFSEKLKEKFSGYEATYYNGYEEGFHDLQEEIDELFKEYDII